MAGETYNPLILEQSDKHLSALDVYSKLSQKRILFISGQIDEELSSAIIAQLLYLDSISTKPITLYIKSCGGYIDDGMAIYDTIMHIKSQVNTICVGKAFSMGAILLIAGEERTILKHSRVMIHQPSSGTYGTAKEFEIDNDEIQKMKKVMFEIVKERTKIENPEEYCRYDTWFNAEEAIKWGIVTRIL